MMQIHVQLSELMKQCIAHLRLHPQIVIVDEIDYLIVKEII